MMTVNTSRYVITVWRTGVWIHIDLTGSFGPGLTQTSAQFSVNRTCEDLASQLEYDVDWWCLCGRVQFHSDVNSLWLSRFCVWLLTKHETWRHTVHGSEHHLVSCAAASGPAGSGSGTSAWQRLKHVEASCSPDSVGTKRKTKHQSRSRTEPLDPVTDLLLSHFYFCCFSKNLLNHDQLPPARLCPPTPTARYSHLSPVVCSVPVCPVCTTRSSHHSCSSTCWSEERRSKRLKFEGWWAVQTQTSNTSVRL